MFVRFRQTKRKLQVSLCETRWTPTGPRQEHIAQLGSVPQPQTIAGRIDFHARLGPRLDRLSKSFLNVHRYASQEQLIADLDEKVIDPAEGKVKELRRRMMEEELAKPQ
jgi:hypothetical protein